MPFMRWANRAACIKDLSKQYSENTAAAVCMRLEQRSKDGAGKQQEEQQQGGQQQQPPQFKRK